MSGRTDTLSNNGEELVKDFVRSGNPTLKDQIVRVYSPLIKHIVGRFNLKHSSTLSEDDLFQYGILGLLKALERFDPEQGVPFKAFVYKRIQGEVIDAMRREGLIGRDMYEKIKKLEKCVKDLGSQLGREPGVYEICREMAITESEYYDLLNTSQMVYTTSLDTKITDEEGSAVYRVDMIQDDSQLSPEDLMTQKNLKTRLKAIINKLPERERLILALYFYEELILADIARIMNLSEARISQILNKTLLDIRTKF